MGDCKLCKPNLIKAEKMGVWSLGIPVPATNKHYLSQKYIAKRTIEKDELRTTDKVTPAGRLLMTEADVSQIMAHYQAWDEFIQSSAEFGAFFETPDTVNNNDIAARLENLELPRDWDIILIDDTEYVLNKRTARILKVSAQQFHCPLKVYLTVFDIFKIISIKPSPN